MFQPKFLSACLVLILLSLSQAATAGVIIAMSPASQNVQQGGSGYMLNFSMTTSQDIDLGGFNLIVAVPDVSGITFTGGDVAVANYVFATDFSGLFLFGNPLVLNSNSGDISDFANSGNLFLAAGTYNLGRMFFSVASNAPLGNVNITLDGATSFTNGLTFDPYDYTPSGGSVIGTINVEASGNLSAVPEPSTLVIFMSVAGLAMLCHQRTRTCRMNLML